MLNFFKWQNAGRFWWHFWSFTKFGHCVQPFQWKNARDQILWKAIHSETAKRNLKHFFSAWPGAQWKWFTHVYVVQLSLAFHKIWYQSKQIHVQIRKVSFQAEYVDFLRTEELYTRFSGIDSTREISQISKQGGGAI